jgi:D-alanyl-D-alanine carboxypeptidase (penicillin-binding protein 5/6)
VALAEHFGDRFDPPSGNSDDQDPLSHFVAEMNRTAVALGMTQTTYKNPHGLTAKGHRSSARDLLKLAHAAIQLPRFREYVGTRQRGCTVVGPGGYKRDVVWKNTNRLLSIDGYHGVKTGTTSAAGACLVSSGRRGDDHLLIAVLGSTSSDARYVDTRNLFRWSWLQRAEQ